MRKSVMMIVSLLAAAWAVPQFSGCSLLGLVIGTQSDREAKKPIARWEIRKVVPGTKIVVYRYSGAQITGSFAGISVKPESQYAEEYAKAREELGSAGKLPEPGGRLTMTSTSGGVYEVGFVGFDFGKIAVRAPGQKSVSPFQWELIKEIKDSQAGILDLGFLRSLISKNKIPSLSLLELDASGTDMLIPVNDIAYVQTKPKIAGALAGFLIGAAVDAGILVVALKNPDALTGGGMGVGSCPLVYCYDGDDFVLDSETFSAAFFKSAPRTDWDNLDHLAAVKGSYRLKIENPFQEIQYVDDISIFAVDHPRGTEVVPSFSGKLHVFSSPARPVRAIDRNGNDILGFLKEKDGIDWVSNPFGRDPESSDQVRDGLELEFSRPRGSMKVRFVLSVRNTAWASFMESHLIRMQGRNLALWQGVMNSSPHARESFQKALERELMLTLRIWTGEGWRDVDHVWSVGPAISKDIAVELDTQDVPGSTLRLGLESTAGMWTIDSVKADFTPEPPITITEAPLERARDEKNADICRLLGEIDGMDFILASDEDRADLVFRAPVVKSGCDRTLILKSTGYYTIPGSPGDEPEKAVAGLLMKPGAFGKYSLELLSGYLRAAIAAFDRP